MSTPTLGDYVLNFSVDLYKQLLAENKPGENIFFSPLSIAAALSMVLAGARNKTAQELRALLHVKGEESVLQEHFSKFFGGLSKYAPDICVYVANRMYSTQELVIQSGYLSLLEHSYRATLRSVDFKNNHEKVRLEANAWVSEQTASKIQNLLPLGSIDSGTVLILLNAIYFKGFWESPFPSWSTRSEKFYLDSHTSMEVDMMFQKESYKIGHCKELKARALELPYRGGKASMIIILPDDTEGLSLLEKSLSSTALSALINGLGEAQEVKLSVPKFKLERDFCLKHTLQALGVKDLVDASVADLSGIFESGKPAVSDVIHKAFIEVDEEGTEAAAATAVMMCGSCGPTPQTIPPFVVDHPFMFLLKSKEPDVILFVGSVRKP